MPFTFAHPAAAIPLRRLLGRFGCMSALAIGSMMPDLPYFLGLTYNREQTHDPSTLLGWSLPAGLLIYVLFQTLLKQALIDLAPPSLQRRLPQGGGMAGMAGWVAVAASVLVGAATHLIWDAFTHTGTLSVEWLPFLSTELGQLEGHTVHLFHVLQFASSGLGLCLLAWWSWRWYQRATPSHDIAPALPAPVRWSTCFALVIVPLAAGAFHAFGAGWDPQRLPHFVLRTLPVFSLMLTVYAAVRRLRRAR